MAEIQEFIRVLDTEIQAIQDFRLRASNDQSDLIKAIDILHSRTQEGGQVLLFGIGKSGKVAQKIAATFSSTGTPATFIHPTEALHGDLGIVRAKDTVIAISYSGKAQEILDLIPFFQNKNIPMISITGDKNSLLAKSSSAAIIASVQTEACPHNLAPTSSTTLALVIGDALALQLMKNRGFTAQDFASNHPAGSLGRRLSLRVENLMHKAPAIPICTPDQPVDVVIELSTRFHLGGVCVVDQGKLVGIITDGDIRRSLKNKNQFFQFTAKDIMNANPTTTAPETLAADALRLMEERPNPLNLLPVVDNNLTPVGMVRLHDLVQKL